MQGVPVFALAVAAFLVFLLLFSAGALNIYLRLRSLKKREEALRPLAQTLGLSYTDRGDPALVAELGLLVHSPKKDAERVANVLRGERYGIAFEAMDYSYTTGSGKHRQHHRLSVVRGRMDFPVPAFFLRPESFLDKIGDWLGWHDIDFPHRPDFSKRYYLRAYTAGGEVAKEGDTPEFGVRALFGDPLLGRLEQLKEEYCLGGRDSWVLIYPPSGKYVAPEDLETYLDQVLPILAAFRGR